MSGTDDGNRPQKGRPAVDVVVPFLGHDEDLAELTARLAGLGTHSGDTVTVVDNRPGATTATASPPWPRVVSAPARQSSYHARNAGAGAGSAEWLLFADADVELPTDLLDRYFDQPVADTTGVLAGGVRDIEVGEGSTAGRFQVERSWMSQANTLHGRWAYAQTANCAVRRLAFDAVGGFTDDIRAGGDADLCFRLRAAGWGIEGREGAAVAHRGRTNVRALLAQRARHGSGAAWLDRAHPGSFPPQRWLGLLRATAGGIARAFACLARRDRSGAAGRLLVPASAWALRLGRLRPNRAGGSRA